ncbi:MAG: hypothetical protein ABJE66_37275 [Deltaproteobacteria bacterium]
MPTRLYAVLTVLLASCGFKPTVGAGDASGPPGDAAVDAPDAGPIYTGKCGSTGAIHDNFDDGVIDNEWRAAGLTTETGGVLSVTPNSNLNFGGYITKHRVDLTGTNVAVEVPQMLDTNSNATAALYLVADPTHYLAITQQDGTLNAEWDTGTNATDLGVDYDPVADRWWRISEASGTVTFEVSADGAAFTPIGTVASPPWVDDIEIAIGGYSDGVVTHGTVEFDNLDDKLDPAGWCKAGGFGDQFMRPTVGYAWTARKTPTTGASGCTATVNNGAHFDQSGIPNSRCWLANGRAYDLAGSYAYAHVGPITMQKPGLTTFLRAISDNVIDAMMIDFDTGNLCAQIRSDTPICRPYDVAADLYWRISEAGGTVVFDASPDTMTWTPIATVPVPFPLNALEIQLGTESTIAYSGPVPLVVGTYNESQN